MSKKSFCFLSFCFFFIKSTCCEKYLLWRVIQVRQECGQILAVPNIKQKNRARVLFHNKNSVVCNVCSNSRAMLKRAGRGPNQVKSRRNVKCADRAVRFLQTGRFNNKRLQEANFCLLTHSASHNQQIVGNSHSDWVSLRNRRDLIAVLIEHQHSVRAFARHVHVTRRVGAQAFQT